MKKNVTFATRVVVSFPSMGDGLLIHMVIKKYKNNEVTLNILKPTYFGR